tara:strand:+ start:24 stop:599 length:576 start_codon:yes stop_codon:yes gene_type:complete
MLRYEGLQKLPDELRYIKNMLNKSTESEPWVSAIIESILSNTGHMGHLYGDGDRYNFPKLKASRLIGTKKSSPINLYYLTKKILEHRLEIRKWSLLEDARVKERLEAKIKANSEAKELAKAKENTKTKAEVEGKANAESPPNNWEALINNNDLREKSNNTNKSNKNKSNKNKSNKTKKTNNTNKNKSKKSK